MAISRADTPLPPSNSMLGFAGNDDMCVKLARDASPPPPPHLTPISQTNKKTFTNDFPR